MEGAEKVVATATVGWNEEEEQSGHDCKDVNDVAENGEAGVDREAFDRDDG